MKDEGEKILENLIASPKLFVSYAWTSPKHIEWVIQLATDLKSFGIDVKIDQWHLREGQDAHSFMEQLVRSDEVEKAILICDKKYVERANKREGGVGIESQIITAEIYDNVKQTKFVCLAIDNDAGGNAAIPNFLKSRVFIDFRTKENYSVSLQQLIRWAYDKPLYKEPELGVRPSFLDEQVDFDAITFPLHNHSEIAGGIELTDYFLNLADKRSSFNIELNPNKPGDEELYKAIVSLGPLLSQVVNQIDQTARNRELSGVELDSTLEYFNSLYANYDSGPTQWSGDATKFFGQFLITAILSRLIKFHRFQTAAEILRSRLIKIHHGGITAEDRPLCRLNTHLKSLDARNARLELRRTSLHSDLIRDTCALIKLPLVEYMQADLIMYLTQTSESSSSYWWPDSLLFASDAHGAFPWFVKALQPSYRDQLLPLIGVKNAFDLEALSLRISGDLPKIRWPNSFASVDVMQLINFEAIKRTFG
jgi:hypothetical protein